MKRQYETVMRILSRTGSVASTKQQIVEMAKKMDPKVSMEGSFMLFDELMKEGLVKRSMIPDSAPPEPGVDKYVFVYRITVKGMDILHRVRS